MQKPVPRPRSTNCCATLERARFPTDPICTDRGTTMAIDRLFLLMKEKAASDMFFAVNSPIQVKINGVLHPINQQRMDQAMILNLLNEVVPSARMAELERDNELNMGIP